MAVWSVAAPADGAGRKPERSRYPEDLGPSEIDVSGYPPEHQRAYRELFVPVFSFLGGAPRAVNSPLIELDEGAEREERASHPELFADPRLAKPSRDAWRRRVDEIRLRPPCCGACPVLDREEARALWRFLAYDSLHRKTGPRAAAWVEHRRRLLARFKAEHPSRYGELFPQGQAPRMEEER